MRARGCPSADTLCRISRTWSRCHDFGAVLRILLLGMYPDLRLFCEAIVVPRARQGCHFGGAEDFGEAGRRPDQISSLAGHSHLFPFFSQTCNLKKNRRKALLRFLLSIRRQYCGLVYCWGRFQIFRNEYRQKPLCRLRAPLLT